MRVLYLIILNTFIVSLISSRFERPHIVAERINARYQKISRGISSLDPCARDSSTTNYRPMGAADLKLILNLLDKSNQDFKVLGISGIHCFNILDVGGGYNHTWAENMARMLEPHCDTTKINIYSIGEERLRAFQKLCSIKGNVTLQIIGSFNIEKLGDFPGDRLFDFIVSSGCFLHLCDPVGTLIQALKLLKIGSVFLGDGFNFEVYDDTRKISPIPLVKTLSMRRVKVRDHIFYENIYMPTYAMILQQRQLMLALLQEIGFPFIVRNHRERVLAFVLQKTRPVNIRWTYNSIQDLSISHIKVFRVSDIVLFRIPGCHEEIKSHDSKYHGPQICGNTKELYDWVISSYDDPASASRVIRYFPLSL